MAHQIGPASLAQSSPLVGAVVEQVWCVGVRAGQDARQMVQRHASALLCGRLELRIISGLVLGVMVRSAQAIRGRGRAYRVGAKGVSGQGLR